MVWTGMTDKSAWQWSHLQFQIQLEHCKLAKSAE